MVFSYYMEVQLGKLENVSLREIWNHEAIDFTNWLAQPENLNLLSDEIGVEITLIKKEAEVGEFHVDILAQEQNTERKIIIENQLEETDHDHLGKLITYASGLNADIIIWIVKDVRDEHRKAVDWLNEHSDGNIKFFIIRMELWKIGSSLPAPKFFIISQPNDWATQIKESVEDYETSETKLLQLEFWNQFKDYAESKNTTLRLRGTRPQHWYSVAIGSSEAHMAYTVNTQDNKIGCEIYIPDSKELFNNLEQNKLDIEREIGSRLEWMKLEGKKASRIKISIDGDITQKEEWEKYFDWMKKIGEKFQNVFYKYLRN